MDSRRGALQAEDTEALPFGPRRSPIPKRFAPALDKSQPKPKCFALELKKREALRPGSVFSLSGFSERSASISSCSRAEALRLWRRDFPMDGRRGALRSQRPPKRSLKKTALGRGSALAQGEALQFWKVPGRLSASGWEALRSGKTGKK